MRHEVIKLTDRAIYPELIKLLSENGDVWGDMLAEYKHNFKILFQNGGWTRAYPQYKADYTITDVDFIQKYGDNTEPEADKERELLEAFWKVAHPLIDGKYTIDLFLSSLRKPAFELITADNVKVDDPGVDVWFIERIGLVKTEAELAKNDVRDRLYFSTREAALNHRLHNSPAIKLSDMTLENDYYWIWEKDAKNLVNERIK